MTDLRERILYHSLRLFSLKGFLSTSVNDIMEAAGTSKGGFYNHFGTKEDLFLQVLDEARRLWRERVLLGLDDVESPTGRVRKLLVNYRDRYLKDTETLPGGCVFLTFSVELDDQLPHLCEEVNRGFVGLRRMLKRLLDEGQVIGELSRDVDTAAVADLLFAGMLGSSVLYGVDKSARSLDSSIASLLSYLDMLGRSELVRL